MATTQTHPVVPVRPEIVEPGIMAATCKTCGEEVSGFGLGNVPANLTWVHTEEN